MQPIVTDQVAWSVGVSVCHTSEPCKNSWTDQDAIRGVELSGPKDVLGGCTLAPPGEYQWTVHVRRRCGHLSNYTEHLLWNYIRGKRRKINQYYLIKLSIKILVLVLKYPGGRKICVVVASEVECLKVTKNSQWWKTYNTEEQRQVGSVSEICSQLFAAWIKSTMESNLY